FALIQRNRTTRNDRRDRWGRDSLERRDKLRVASRIDRCEHETTTELVDESDKGCRRRARVELDDDGNLGRELQNRLEIGVRTLHHERVRTVRGSGSARAGARR